MPNNQQSLETSSISTKTLTKIRYRIKKQAYLESLKVKCKPKTLKIFKTLRKYRSPWGGFEPTPYRIEIMV